MTIEKIVGERSEANADRILGRMPQIAMIVASTPEQDYAGIDRWIMFGREFGHRINALQIKSSDSDVENFRSDPRYCDLVQKFGVLVINTLTGRNIRTIQKNFWEEVDRIEGLLVA